jgi:Ala-tRNA(Pro) deacylase
MSKGIDAVTQFLDQQQVSYEVIEHGERFTAAAEARASGIGLEDAAKDVVLRSGDQYILAVIPASERLDLKKAHDLLGVGGEELRLATEDELAAAFPDFELGALPPFGPIHEIAQMVDRRLLDHDQVLCSSGDHRHSLAVDPNEVVRVSKAQVGDISQD